MKNAITYANSGVDIDKANKLADRIKEIAKATYRSGVMGEIGGFGGLFSLNLARISNPVLVSSTDGVGAKLKIAFMMDKHDTVGIDLVAMCVNDIIVQGASPLFFLDYLAMGRLDNSVAEKIIQGIADGCKQSGCALIGGETAEMPGMYQDGEYDLSGFSVGIVDDDNIIDGAYIKHGHKLIGLASSGVHNNGFSLVRKIFFEKCNYNVDTRLNELGISLGEELLKPTTIYVPAILSVIRDLPIHGLSHITGSGIDENIARVIPETCKAVIQKDAWEVPAIFKILQKEGAVPDHEMQRTFNNGIGMVIVVPETNAQEVIDRLSGSMNEKVFSIGEIESREPGKAQTEWV